MSAKPGTALVVLAVPVTAFGSYLVWYAAGRGWYEASTAMGGLGVGGVGLALMAFGLAKRGRPALGIGMAVVGLGLAALLVQRAASRDHEERDQMARSAAIADAVWPVCSGTGLGQAAALAEPGHGVRPLVIFTSYKDVDTHHYAWADDERWRPTTTESTQLVACFESVKDVIGSCAYEKDHYVSRIRYVMKGTIREAKTGRVVAETSFTGGEPGECASAIREDRRDEFTGSMPPDEPIRAWVHAYAAGTPAEKL